MKRLLTVAAILVLMGAGCGPQTNVNVQTDNGVTTQPNTQGPDVSIGATGNVDVTVGGVTVMFNGTVFSPTTITIANGGTVTWKNDSSGNLQVASDPHPTHTGYPGFDSKAAISPGQEWSFTFTKSGTWGYHDHFNPAIHGIIIVK